MDRSVSCILYRCIFYHNKKIILIDWEFSGQIYKLSCVSEQTFFRMFCIVFVCFLSFYNCLFSKPKVRQMYVNQQSVKKKMELLLIFETCYFVHCVLNHIMFWRVRMRMRACVRACVRACACVCVCVCVCARACVCVIAAYF